MKVFQVFAGVVLFVASSTSTLADTSIGTCVDSYVLASEFRAKVRVLEAQKDAIPFHGLAAYADGFDTIDFEARARDVDKRDADPKASSTRVLDARLGSSKRVDELIGEVGAASLIAVAGAPDKMNVIYASQRALLSSVRACDAAYRFKPQLGDVPSVEKIAATLKAGVEKSVKADHDRLAKLDDQHCAIRFELVANLYPAGSPSSMLMHQRAGAAGEKALAALPGMPRERFAQQLQRELVERAEKYKSGSYKLSEIIEELNACERRYNMTVSDIHAN